MKDALKEYSGTMIVVSHDREFLTSLTSKTLEFNDHKIKTYLGDVNYFLEKRKIDDIRKIEISDKKNEKSSQTESLSENDSNKSNKQSFENRKIILKEIRSIERKIEQIEEEIKSIELEMLNPEFHSNPKSVEKLKKHVDLKQALDDWMDKWTVAQEQLDVIP